MLRIGTLVLCAVACCHAQDLAAARAAAKIDTAIPWITDGFHPTDPGQPVKTLPPGPDRNRLLDEALKRARDEKKLVFWYVPRIEGGHMVRPEILDGYMRVLAFTDPSLTKLINARFVPLRMAVDQPIAARTGIKRLDWVEPAIVILGPDGAMLHRLDRIRSFDAGFFRSQCLRVLDAHRALAPTPEGFRAEDDGPKDPLTRRGLDALRTGDLPQARAALADAAGSAENPDRARALYTLGIVLAMSREQGAAEEAFRDVAAAYADDPVHWPYAAQAASNLVRARDSTPLGPAFHSYIDPVRLPDAVLAESRSTTAYARPADQAADVARRGVAFLLRHQHENGGWEDSRYAFCESPRILPNVWVAITAIVLSGLDDWRETDPKGVDDAIARGEKYLFDPANVAPGRNEECYADTFRLLYLVRRFPRAAPEQRPRIRKLLNDVSKNLVGQQTEAGFWAHEYPNPFAAAAALHALRHAQEAGAAVSNTVFEQGSRAVRSTRGQQGTFGYGAGRPRRESPDALKNAMARMPICERVLLFGTDLTDPTATAALEASLDNFWEQLPRIERIRTCDFHADGELGGFFFWHGVFLTSESVKALPAEKRAAHERRMIEHVTSIGEIDGSFVDSHELGKSYGTGMALMVLRNSLQEP